MNLKSELEITTAAGGLVGAATRAQWAELLERMGGGLVRSTIAKLKAKLSKRQISVYEAAKAMGYTLKTAAGAELELPASEPTPATPVAIARPPAEPEEDQVDDDELEPDDEAKVTADAEASEIEREEEPATQEVESESLHPLAEAPKCERPPVTDERNTVSGEQKPPKREPGPRSAYLFRETLKACGGLTAVELATRALAPRDKAERWIGNHRRELVGDGSCPKRYWFKADPSAPDYERAPGLKELNAEVSLEISGEPKVSRATSTSSSAELTAADLPALVLSRQDLDGELVELLGRVIDAYSEHHEIIILPKPRRALDRACAAIFPA